MFTSITFTSDFGSAGGYVAACEARLLTIAPAARILHVDHDVAPGDVGAGGRVMARIAPLSPVSVHLGVVDPGVGGGRRAVALHSARGDYFVGPDNGLLLPAAEALGGAVAAWVLEPQRVSEQADLGDDWRLSATFHGRDVFAPAAALLSRDLPGSLIGDPIDPSELVPGRYPRAEREGERFVAEVTEIDRFGNVALGVDHDVLERFLGGSETIEVRTAGGLGRPVIIRRARTFGELPPGVPGMLADSWGDAAICLNSASAAEKLGVSLGELLTLSPAAEAEAPPGYVPENLEP